MNKRTYILGPMRRIPLYNFPAFDAMAARLRKAGFEVVNPAEMDRETGFNPYALAPSHDWSNIPATMDQTDIISRDLAALRTCTHYVALPGWERSVGANAEKALLTWQGAQRLDTQDLEPWKEPAVASSPELGRQDSPAAVRVFATGATRDADDTKFDYEGFLSPLALEAYGHYMHKHRKQTDGALRASDNWQKGIPKTAYVKSAFRHFFQFWKLHRGLETRDEKGKLVTFEDALCGLLFNAFGYLHEVLKAPGSALTPTPVLR